MGSFIYTLLVEKKNIEDFFQRYADLLKSKGSNLQAGTSEDFTLCTAMYLLQLKFIL